MRLFKTLPIVMLILGSSSASFCQSETGASPFMNDSNGRPLYLKTNYTADGSPYLFDDYLPATLTTESGRVYKDVMIKLNLVDNEVLYRLADGKEMVSTTPIQKISMFAIGQLYSGLDSMIISGINTPLNSRGAITYIVYSSGKLTLLKKVSVTYKDMQEYGNTNTTRVFKRKESFFFMDKKGVTDQVGKSTQAVLDLFNDKRKNVEQYVNQNRLDLRNEKHLVSAFNYYNSLF
jgi:hypothetical protein